LPPLLRALRANDAGAITATITATTESDKTDATLTRRITRTFLKV